MPAREWAISPPLFGPEVGNSKLPKREMSLSVPNFSGALLLSMRSFPQVTLRTTILKYHSWYLCQISLQIMLLRIQM